MNSITLICNVAQSPETRYTQNQDREASVLLSFDDNGNQTYIKGIAYKKSAEAIAKLPLGADVVVTGSLRSYTIERPEGFKERRVDLIVRSSQVISGSTSYAQPDFAPAQGSNVIAVETNNETNIVPNSGVVSSAPVPQNVETYPAAQVAAEDEDIPF